MKKVYRSCCGIDVHKKLIVACFLQKSNKSEVREFGATTSELLKLSDWLTEGGCEMVAMESTGSYWKPVYNIFESAGLKCMIVNASHMKNVPGRKTDIQDAEWIADLLKHGLLEASFIPDRQQRELRELVGYRSSLIGEKTRELNRIQKVLEGANIKISGTIKNINGKSGRCLLDAIADGRKLSIEDLEQMKNEHQIAHNLKATNEQLAEDLNGVINENQVFLLKEMLKRIDELDAHIATVSGLIDKLMTEEQLLAADKITQVTGIGLTSAQAIISVIGSDMSRFPTDASISKWAGLCPGNNESANKRGSGRTQKGNKLLRTTLTVCANSAVTNKDSYFYAQFKRISAHRGKKRAIIAVAHSMLIAIYHMLKDNVDFVDLGSDYYNRFNKEKKINAYIKKLQALGVVVELKSTTTQVA